MTSSAASSAPAVVSEPPDARARVRSPGLNQFRLNPFRVLDLPVDAEAAKALWKAEKMLTRARAGLTPTDALALPWLPPVDELEIQQAAQVMEEPLRRLSEQLLWFDFAADPRGEELRRALVRSDAAALAAYLATTTDALEEQFAEQEGETTAAEPRQALPPRVARMIAHRINQANLRLALGFSFLYGLVPELSRGAEQDSRAAAGFRFAWEQRRGLTLIENPHALEGEASGTGRAWQEHLAGGLARWSQLLQDVWFGPYLEQQISRLADDLVSADDRESLASAIQTRLADLVVGEVKQRLLGGQVKEATALSQIASRGSLDPQVWTLAFRPLRSLFRAELGELDPLVDESRKVHLRDISMYLQRLKMLNMNWRNIDSKDLLGLAPLIDEAVLRAFERIRMLDFPLSAVDPVCEVLQEARNVANSQSVKERITALSSRLTQRKEGLCYYCGKREQEFEYAAALSGRVETGRTRGFNSTTIHYQVRAIPILRCKPCAELHGYFGAMGWWSVAAGVIATFMGMFFWQEVAPTVLLYGAVLTWLLQWMSRRILAILVTPKGEKRYWRYAGSPSYNMLTSDGYGSFQYNYSPRGWSKVAARKS